MQFKAARNLLDAHRINQDPQVIPIGRKTNFGVIKKNIYDEFVR
jgi:hypothetical protein